MEYSIPYVIKFMQFHLILAVFACTKSQYGKTSNILEWVLAIGLLFLKNLLRINPLKENKL